jgi:hypothetical protein
MSNFAASRAICEYDQIFGELENYIVWEMYTVSDDYLKLVAMIKKEEPTKKSNKQQKPCESPKGSRQSYATSTTKGKRVEEKTESSVTTQSMEQMENKQQQYDEKMEEVKQKCDHQIEQLMKSMETELKVTNKKVHQISEQVKQTVTAHQMDTSMKDLAKDNKALLQTENQGMRQWFTELIQGNQTNIPSVQSSSPISDAVLMSIDMKTGKRDLEVLYITPPTKHQCLPGAKGNNSIKVKSESNDHEYETY